MVVEINADNRMAAHVAFDPDDINGALAELDGRAYIAGRSGGPLTHVVGRREGLRRVQPARRPRNGRGRRPPARNAIRVQQPDRVHPRHLGPHTRPHHPYRGGASAQQFRSSRNPCGLWDLSRRLLRRVADEIHLLRSRAIESTAASYSTRRTWPPRSRGSTNSIRPSAKRRGAVRPLAHRGRRICRLSVERAAASVAARSPLIAVGGGG